MIQQVLQGVAAKLRFVNTDQDGSPAAAAGVVTVRVTRSDGTEVLPTGSATTAGAGTGEYERALTPAQTASLDLLTATWTDAGDASVHVTKAEIVGGYAFSVVEARAADSMFVEATYPTPIVVQARAEVEEAVESVIEQALGRRVGFVPRFRRVVLSGNGLDVVNLPDYFVRSVRSVTVDDETAFSAGELADLAPASGQLTSTLRTWTRGTRNIVVSYEHGLDSPPAVIKRAALLLFKAWLPAFKRSGDEISLASAKSAHLEGVGLSFDVRSGDATGITEVDRLVKTWLATPDLASVPV